MSKESYARGFIKVSSANGVDPRALAKYAQKGDGIDMALAMEAYRRAKDKPAFSMPFVVRRKEDAQNEHEEKSIVAAIADAIRKMRGMKKKAASDGGPKYQTGGYAPEGANVGKLPEFRSDGQVGEADTPRKLLQSVRELLDQNEDSNYIRSLDERYSNYIDAAKKSYLPIYDKTIEWLRAKGDKALDVLDVPFPAHIYDPLTRNFDRSMYNYTNEPPASVSVQRPERLRSDRRAGSR